MESSTGSGRILELHGLCDRCLRMFNFSDVVLDGETEPFLCKTVGIPVFFRAASVVAGNFFGGQK